ncbi:consensus disorder prediction [Desulfoluna spongiiphila]|nr:consensus disorder prediction [Desulfoluna spongiiphila]
MKENNMTSHLSMPRIVAFVLALLVSGPGLAMAAEEQPMMKMPVDGACEEPYILFEGVCAIPAFMQGQPGTILEQIKAFKKDHENLPQEPEPPTASASVHEDPLCARYKKLIEEHLNSKAATYNPDSVEVEKARGQAAETSIEEAREYLINFCQD